MHVALVLYGIPQNSVKKDIYGFFAGFKFIKNSAKLNIDERRMRLNSAAILFES